MMFTKKNEIIKIQHVKGSPTESRLYGAWTGPGGYRDLLILGIPLVGLIFLFIGFLQGKAYLNKLRSVILDNAFLIESRPVTQEVAPPVPGQAKVLGLKGTKYLHTFFYFTPNGERCQFLVEGSKRLDSGEPTETIYYSAENPTAPELLSSLSGEVYFSKDGQRITAGLSVNFLGFVMVMGIYGVLFWKLVIGFEG